MNERQVIAIALSALAACTTAPAVGGTAAAPPGGALAAASDEERWYATQAALLDPRCWQIEGQARRRRR